MNSATQGRPFGRRYAASVQASSVPVEQIRHGVVCLRAFEGRLPSYHAVLEVEGINYLLLGEAEQLRLHELFRTLLASLSFPLQLLLRVLPLDPERFLRHLRPSSQPGTAAGSAPSGGAAAAAPSPFWEQLAASERALFASVTARKRLLERRFYLIVPADAPVDAASAALGYRLPGARRRAPSAQEAFLRASQQLELRCQELARHLQTLGLAVRRLRDQELVELEYSAYSPRHAQAAPLSPLLAAAVDRLPLRSIATPPPAPASLPVSGAQDQPQPAEAPPALRRRGCRRRVRRQESAHAPTLTRLADLLAPEAVALAPTHLQVGTEYTRTLVVRAFPRFVSLGWLKPLLTLDEPMEISLHLHPKATGPILRLLQRKLLEYQSAATLASEHDRLLDPDLAVARRDLEPLLTRLASGEERMLGLTCCVLLRAPSLEALEERCARVSAILHAMLLLVRPATFEHDRGFVACLPHGYDALQAEILLDSSSVATLFPFVSSSLLHEEGILEGITSDGMPVVLDWWHPQFKNANRLLVAPSGAGKSYTCKLELLRLYLRYGRALPPAAALQTASPDDAAPSPPTLPYQAIVIDPEREYLRLCQALGGQWIRLAPGSAQRLNPFALPVADPAPLPEEGDRLADQIQRLHTLLELLLADRGPTGPGTLSAQEKGLLDRALYEVYRERGIGVDPATHRREPPLLRDLYRVLESGVCGPDPSGLAPRLRRFVAGSLAGLFEGQTNVALDRHLVVFDLHDLDAELRPIGYFLIAQFVWTASFGSSIPRHLIVDELLSLYQYAEGKRFLETLFQRARKHYLSVTGVTQHPGLLAESSIPANCATVLLLAQEAASLDAVSALFKLTEREAQLLRTCGKGDALLVAGDRRLFLHIEASALQHEYATTDPRELAAVRQAAALASDASHRADPEATWRQARAEP